MLNSEQSKTIYLVAAIISTVNMVEPRIAVNSAFLLYKEFRLQQEVFDLEEARKETEFRSHGR